MAVDKRELFERKERLDDLRAALGEALERRRPAVVYGLAKLFQRALADAAPFASAKPALSDGWQSIESLSQLRTLVGGRFQNLKQKWIGAGLPLREHRGDREQDAAINQAGWVELALWINKQGFEARLPAGPGNALFEVRLLDRHSAPRKGDEL